MGGGAVDEGGEKAMGEGDVPKLVGRLRPRRTSRPSCGSSRKEGESEGVQREDSSEEPKSSDANANPRKGTNGDGRGEKGVRGMCWRKEDTWSRSKKLGRKGRLRDSYPLISPVQQGLDG